MNRTLSIADLLSAYRRHILNPRENIRRLMTQIRQSKTTGVWIHVASDAWLEPYLAKLEQPESIGLPLFGIPFAVKDNIDVAGMPTTAACPDFAYTPTMHAPIVEKLIAAGAIPLGKTNLDQFATGLVGTRSPYGVCRNSFDDRFVSGGSSSGSAVALALGQVCFALGTDTAGSGRIPAAFNNLVGWKPTRGLISTRGVVPACRSLDCVSVFTTNGTDCQILAGLLTGPDAYDPQDPFSRKAPEIRELDFPTDFSFGVPPVSQWVFGDGDNGARLFQSAIDRMIELGGKKVTLDFTPFFQAARLLYDGPWIAERWASVGRFLESHPHALLPITEQIISRGKALSAADVFLGMEELRSYIRVTTPLWDQVEVMLLPTAPFLPRIEDVEHNPLTINQQLGTYTNFMNLMDFSAVAVPAGFSPQGLPFGVTLFAPAWRDHPLLTLANRFEGQNTNASQPSQPSQQNFPTLPVLSSTTVIPQNKNVVLLAVCGAHMRGMPLNPQLVEAGGQWLETTTTSVAYRLYHLMAFTPARPGLVRQQKSGKAITVEVWSLPPEGLGHLMPQIPFPLAIGPLELQDGRWINGFLCQRDVAGSTKDISHFGGWREYLDKTQVELNMNTGI